MTKLHKGEFIIEVERVDDDFASGIVFWPDGEVLMSDDDICPARALIDLREWRSRAPKLRPGMQIAGYLSRARQGGNFDYFGGNYRVLDTLSEAEAA